MSRIQKKHIAFGTGATEVNAQVVPANFTPTNYTPTQVASEGTDKISAHLKGIDLKLVSFASVGDIPETSYSKTAGVELALTNEVITGFAFPEATVRSFDGLLSVQVDTTVDLWEVYKVLGIQLGSGVWQMSSEGVGNDSTITLNIASVSSSGQLRYSMAADASRTAVNMKFRAITTSL